MQLNKIFKQLGGIKSVAQQIGCSIQVIYLASHRNRLPVRYWEKFLDLCEEMKVNVNLRDLIKLYNHKLPT